MLSTSVPNTAAPTHRLLTRVDSIDVLRALTMVLMIFVNDLWSLTAIPAWLEHVPGGALPCRTTVFVGLPHPEMLVEIDAFAVV